MTSKIYLSILKRPSIKSYSKYTAGFLFCFHFGVTPICARGLVLSLCLEITPDGCWEIIFGAIDWICAPLHLFHLINLEAFEYLFPLTSKVGVSILVTRIFLETWAKKKNKAGKNSKDTQIIKQDTEGGRNLKDCKWRNIATTRESMGEHIHVYSCGPAVLNIYDILPWIFL